MSERDPAAARFAAIQAVRLGGVAAVIVGMLVSTHRIVPSAPTWAGYILLAAGLVGALVLPAILVRKWRTPR